MIFKNPKYILPTGAEWNGPVFELKNGDFVTGTRPNPSSIPLVKIDESFNFPTSGSVASQDILRQLFSYTTDSSFSSESALKDFNKKIASLSLLIKNKEESLSSALTKIKDHLNSKKIQTDNNGRGSLIDGDLHYTLEKVSSKDQTGYINTVSYVHGDDTNHFLYAGNAEAGLLYTISSDQDEITEITKRRLNLEMVSRTANDVVEILPADFLLDSTYDNGFKGKLVVSLNPPTSISFISLPNNIYAETVLLNEGTDKEKECPLNEIFEPTEVTTITVRIKELREPIEFSSYFSEDLKEDYMGLDTVGVALSKNAYQRTRIEMGPLKVSLNKYKNSSSFLMGKYTSTAGALASINFTASEELNGSVPDDTSFQYYLVINNNEYRVYPVNRAGDGIHTYRINSFLSKEARATVPKGTGFIDTTTPTVSWKLKVILNESENTLASPLLKQVRFSYLTSLSGGINV